MKSPPDRESAMLVHFAHLIAGRATLIFFSLRSGGALWLNALAASAM
jgi:hypothetical protein